MTDIANEIEEGLKFTPRFDSQGLVTAVVTDHKSGDVLMVAHMNAEAIRATLASGEAYFWSRSRQALWRKGETSGNVLRVREVRVDCDQDALWLIADLEGSGVCHTGRASCFYRVLGANALSGQLNPLPA
ncbi:MAG: phosphoribosyl-AMP cyclohydrolase [Hyphomicrobiales bacterium]|nr:phosphoribosyl-AMP cyclohydrolase [Hyphomicrobiales bacterium]